MQIKLQGISKAYGRLAVLKNCDLALKSGQLLCLVGSNELARPRSCGTSGL
jgi:ABC-type sugar transport system ATPase subunit